MSDQRVIHFGGAIAISGVLAGVCGLCLLAGVFILVVNRSPARPEPEVARLPPLRLDTAPGVPSQAPNLPVGTPEPGAPPAVPASEPGPGQPPPTVTNSEAEETPQVTPLEGNVNLYRGPGVDYQVFGVLPAGQRLEVVGRNQDSTWWQVSGPGGVAWVDAALVAASNVAGIPLSADIPAAPEASEPALPTEPTPVPPPPSAPPTGPLPVRLIELTSPVLMGDEASLTIETVGGASCLIEVMLEDGPSQAPGLEPTVAGLEDGRCNWTWEIYTDEATPGDWPIRVTVEANEQRNVLSTGFTIQ